MNLSSSEILPADGSKRVAIAIADMCPAARFCIFTATDDGRKLPRSKSGPGVSIETDKADLYTPDEVKAHDSLPDNQYWGLYMHEPLTDMFELAVLTVLDVDLKRSTSTTDMRIQRLAKWAKDHGHMAERSHSKKGRHVIFLAKPSNDILPKYKLQDHQEIEVFGQPNSPKKSLMLTGDMLTQTAINNQDVDVEALIQELGIQAEPEQKKPQTLIPVTHTAQPDDLQKAADALHYISPDVDYAEWIQLGQALHDGFPLEGRDVWERWSQGGEKYQGTKDIDIHWKSFHAAKGVGLGTLFHMAKSNGYKPPTTQSEQRTAVQDFMQRQASATALSTAPDKPPAPEPTSGWQEMDYSLDHLPAVRYVIDGFLAHGLWIIAGQPGVGKTTVLMSLMMTITRCLTNQAITSSKPRKIIIVTEDADQLIRGLYGYARHFKIDPQRIISNVVIIRAMRSTLPEILELEHNVVKHTLPDGTRPLLILDTANATLALENENDNSEVGAYMSGLKQTIYTILDTPIAIVSHMNKQISRTDSDAMARGASAFTGDATGTAVIFADEDGSRYMRLIKRRYEPDFDEIEFVTETFTALAASPDGEFIETVCRVMTPAISSAELRQQKASEQKDETKQQRAQDKADEACLYVQSIINAYPQGVVMRRGRTAPRNPPSDMTHCHRLEVADVFSAIPGSSRGDVKTAVVEAIMRRFAPGSSANEWVRLGGEK